MINLIDWPRIAKYFNVEYDGFNDSIRALDEQMRNDGTVWDTIVERYGLEQNKPHGIQTWIWEDLSR